MAERRPPMKSEPLMAPMSHEAKRAFLAARRTEGRTASGVARELIDGWLERSEARARLRDRSSSQGRLVMTLRAPFARSPFVQGGAVAAALAAVAAAFVFTASPSAAAFDFRASFDALDENHDGVITREEYAGGGSHSTLAIDFEAMQAPVAAPPAPLDGATNPEVQELTRTNPSEPRRVMTRLSVMMDIDFAATDRDDDGALDFGEFVARHEALLGEEFMSHDFDGDGRLSPDELLRNPDTPTAAPAPFPQLLFHSFDGDGDGAISLEEFEAGPG